MLELEQTQTQPCILLLHGLLSTYGLVFFIRLTTCIQAVCKARKKVECVQKCKPTGVVLLAIQCAQKLLTHGIISKV